MGKGKKMSEMTEKIREVFGKKNVTLLAVFYQYFTSSIAHFIQK